MTARAAFLVLAALSALAAAGAPRFVAGPELDVGPLDPAVPRPSSVRAAMATDGDTILAVHTTDQHHGPLFATRIDRSGRVLTPQPIPLVPRTTTTGVLGTVEPHVLWFRGHYLVFYVNQTGGLDVLRVTADGTVAGRAALPLIGGSAPFEVATDGTEIVLVNHGSKLLRVGADLKPIGTVDLPEARSYPAAARGVAFGGGRFAIVTAAADGVTSQFLEHGQLSPLVRIADANIDSSGVTRVAWTGTEFVAAWTECAKPNDYLRACLGAWTPLAPAGEAARPIHVLGHTQGERYDLTLTVLDEQTLFFTWRDSDEEVAPGRRYRVSGEAVGEAADFGTGPLAALRTPDGALAVLDARRRLAWVDAPATAMLRGEVPLVPAVVVPRAGVLLAAAVSAREAAVIRRSVTDAGSLGAEMDVLSHDGTPLRTIPLATTDVFQAAVASDGRDFFALVQQWSGRLTFYAPASGRSVPLAERASSPHLVWSGEELLGVWNENERLQLVRLDRNGTRLAAPLLLDGQRPLRFIARGGRVLLATSRNQLVSVTLFDTQGNRVGAAEEIGKLYPDAGLALATDGRTDAFAAVDWSVENLFLAVRPRHGTFVAAPATPEPPPPARPWWREAALSLAPTNDGFVLAYGVSGPVLPSMYLALLDRQGFAVSSYELPAGASGANALLETGPGTLLLVYARMADEPKYGGLQRVFARTIALRHDTMRRRAARN